MAYFCINEAEFIADIRHGNREAFKHAFIIYYPKLCRYTSKFTMDPDLAEDIVQEIFIKLWNKRTRLNIDTSLESYLFRSCYNSFIDHFRDEKRINRKLEEYRNIKLLSLEAEDSSMIKK